MHSCLEIIDVIDSVLSSNCFLEIMSEQLDWIQIWELGGMINNRDSSLMEPLCYCFCSMAWGLILLKINGTSFLLDLPIEFLQCTLKNLLFLPSSCHSSSLPSWVFQYQQWAFLVCNNACPHHYTYW